MFDQRESDGNFISDARAENFPVISVTHKDPAHMHLITSYIKSVWKYTHTHTHAFSTLSLTGALALTDGSTR